MRIYALLASAILSANVYASGFLSSSSTEPYAHIMTGAELFESYRHHINRTDDYFERGIYYGFVVAVADTASGTLFCLPTGTNARAIGDIVGRYLTDNPQRRHFSAARLVAESLSIHYPCK